jgi:predicted metal-dependent HD superfamily phosphohydrolase
MAMNEKHLQSFLNQPKYWTKNLFTQEILEELVTIYSHPHRHYHNIKHIQQMLDCLDEVREFSCLASLRQHPKRSQNLAILQLATWFHDVVYNPRASDNEEQSIIFISKNLQKLNLSTESLEKVKTIILLTKTHQYFGCDRDIQTFLDADLSILGSTPLEYKAYMTAIRREYNWVSQQEYCLKRKAILEKILTKKRIYQTDYFYQKLEKRARENLEKEIQILKSI